MANVNYDINYDDKRFQTVESDKSAALSDIEKTYGGMIDNTDKYYQAQIDASKEWADKQSQLQQEKTDFAIEEIEHAEYEEAFRIFPFHLLKIVVLYAVDKLLYDNSSCHLCIVHVGKKDLCRVPSVNNKRWQHLHLFG